MINRRYALFGKNIQHSLSPFIHNRAFELMNINAIYELYDVNSVEEILKIIKKNNILGANITTPYKKDIIKHLDEISYMSKITNSVNTIKVENSKLYGDTTDGIGFLNTLPDYIKSISIFGCGAAARSIVAAISYFTDIKINIISRRKSFNEDQMLYMITENTLKNVKIYHNLLDADVVVNATTLGMFEDKSIVEDFNFFKNAKLFIDIIYKNNDKTLFLKNAEKYDKKIMDGKNMLINQANLSFEIWTGKKFNSDYIKNELIK